MRKGFATAQGCRDWLAANGFVPASSSKKDVGVFRFWKHADGRRVRVSYGLLSTTGQSSRGSAAFWGYKISLAT